MRCPECERYDKVGVITEFANLSEYFCRRCDIEFDGENIYTLLENGERQIKGLMPNTKGCHLKKRDSNKKIGKAKMIQEIYRIGPGKTKKKYCEIISEKYEIKVNTLLSWWTTWGIGRELKASGFKN